MKNDSSFTTSFWLNILLAQERLKPLKYNNRSLDCSYAVKDWTT